MTRTDYLLFLVLFFGVLYLVNEWALRTQLTPEEEKKLDDDLNVW